MAEILVVEDDATIRDVVIYRLEAAGHRLLTAADGVEGVARFRSGKPDLVILDLMLAPLPRLDVLRIVPCERGVPSCRADGDEPHKSRTDVRS